MLAVLDIGKTHSRVLILDSNGAQCAERKRKNSAVTRGRIRALDAEAIGEWLLTSLAELAGEYDIETIIPVGHGATAALVADNHLLAPVLDYECDPPGAVAAAYESLRDEFARTYSPRLPHGLNLGLQLYWQEMIYPGRWPALADALLWPQYWAWFLCGERAAEVTSLGCHTDLWFPLDRTYSSLAKGRGWAEKLGRIKPANCVLGTLRESIAARTKLDGSCEVLCGIHDSNAALFGVRGFVALSDGPFALISTGTWFVAMQTGVKTFAPLDPARDALANVDLDGNTVPSARFMGGREYETLVGARLGARATKDAALRLITRNTMSRPSFVEGCGPFPHSRGTILGDFDEDDRPSLAALYLALMSDQSLDCISSEGPIVIEGRFADDAIFPAALAALRPHQKVFRSAVGDGIALGAARLRDSQISPQQPLEAVEPLTADMQTYRSKWLKEIEQANPKTQKH